MKLEEGNTVDKKSLVPFGMCFVCESRMGPYSLLWVFYHQQELVLRNLLFFTLVSLGRKLSGFLFYPSLGRTRLFIRAEYQGNFCVSDHCGLVFLSPSPHLHVPLFFSSSLKKL